MPRNLSKTYNNDVVYILPSGGITLEVPFEVNIYFNKSIASVNVTREIDDADFDQTLVTSTTWNYKTHDQYSKDESWPGSAYTSCSHVFWSYCYNTKQDVLFIVTYNRSTEPTLAITSVSDNGGLAQIEIDDNNLAEGDKVQIASTHYSGIYNVKEIVDDNNFIINEPYTSDDTGTAKLCLVIPVYNQRMINNQKLEGVTE